MVSGPAYWQLEQRGGGEEENTEEWGETGWESGKGAWSMKEEEEEGEEEVEGR